MGRNVAEIWEGVAHRDPAFYTLARRATHEAVLASGRSEVRKILTSLGQRLSGRRLAIDVGCGVGRLTIPLAREFERVVAVDAAPAVLERLAAHCHAAGVSNVHTVQADAAWGRGADLVVSCLTLQHLDEPHAVGLTVERIGAALAPGGLAWIQVDSRRRTPLYALRNRIPDTFLPACWRRGIRRIRRPAATYAALFESERLAVVAERNGGTSRHVFVLGRLS